MSELTHVAKTAAGERSLSKNAPASRADLSQPRANPGLIARKLLARHGAACGRARSRLAPPDRVAN
jgi:hypothetical protein